MDERAFIGNKSQKIRNTSKREQMVQTDVSRIGKQINHKQTRNNHEDLLSKKFQTADISTGGRCNICRII